MASKLPWCLDDMLVVPLWLCWCGRPWRESLQIYAVQQNPHRLSQYFDYPKEWGFSPAGWSLISCPFLSAAWSVWAMWLIKWIFNSLCKLVKKLLVVWKPRTNYMPGTLSFKRTSYNYLNMYIWERERESFTCFLYCFMYFCAFMHKIHFCSYRYSFLYVIFKALHTHYTCLM